MLKNISLLVLSLVACKAYQTPASTENQERETVLSKPSWVTSKPTSNEYYIGIGNAPLSDPNHQANAKLEALDDLASEIRVIVESSSLLNQIESRSGFDERFQSAIKSITRQSLELHEQVASWSDDRYYWVQYRLSKTEYNELKKSKKNAASLLAKEHFINGKEAQDEGEIVPALHFYAQCIESLSGYINEPTVVSIDGHSVELLTESFAYIATILSGISLSSDSTSYQLGRDESHRPIIIRALTKNKHPIQGLSLTINGESDKVTNRKGEIYIDPKVKKNISKILAIGDYGFLRQYALTSGLVSDISPAQIQIQLLIPPITIQLSSEEQNLSQSMNRNILLPVIEKILTQEGFGIVNNSGDYSIRIHSNTRKGSEISGLFTSYLDFTLGIRDSDDKQVFSDSFSNVKGIHTSYQSAGIRAYQNVEKQLLEQLKASLNKNFINKD